MLQAQADLAGSGVRADDLDDYLVSRLKDFLWLVDTFFSKFRYVNQPFDAVVEPGESAEGDQLGNGGFDVIADVIPLAHLAPGIGVKLFDAEGNLFVLGVYVEHLYIYFVTLLKQFGRMVDFFCPRHVGYVQEPVDAFFDLNEGSVVGEVAHEAWYDRSRRIFLLHLNPRILPYLLESERNLFVLGVYVKQFHVDFLADVDDFGGMPNALGPRHFGYVDHPLNAFFELDKGAVIGHADDLSPDDGPRWIVLVHVAPRVGAHLFQAEGYLFFFLVEIQHLDRHLIAYLAYLRGVLYPAP